MVALAEELLALLTLLVTSLLGMPVSAIEMATSLRLNRINPASMIARIVKKNSLCTSTSL
jgi:ribosomal protein L30/L7E